MIDPSIEQLGGRVLAEAADVAAPDPRHAPGAHVLAVNVAELTQPLAEGLTGERGLRENAYPRHLSLLLHLGSERRRERPES